MDIRIEIVGCTVVKVSDRKHHTRQQYAVRITLEDGRVITRRLTGFYPASRTTKLADEPIQFQRDLNLKVLNIIQNLNNTEPLQGGSCMTKQCKRAMEEYVAWHMENRRNPKVKYYAKKFNENFDKKPLREITREAAREWVGELITDGYKYDSVRLAVATASGMISWLESQDKWTGKNPFSGLLKEYNNSFPADEPEKSYFTDDELQTILSAVQVPKYAAARVFIEIARCTGLRPSEIIGDPSQSRPALTTDKLDQNNLTWSVLVSKTHGRQFYRTICIPRCLVTFLANESVTGSIIITENQLRYQFDALRRETGIDLYPKTFRKHFAHHMESVGASDSIINLHQGRSQHGVLHTNYLTDPNRAVRLCRPFISLMFDKPPALSVVKQSV